jgi:3D (Asp-Asp-Asp) domain-containing protein
VRKVLPIISTILLILSLLCFYIISNLQIDNENKDVEIENLKIELYENEVLINENTETIKSKNEELKKKDEELLRNEATIRDLEKQNSELKKKVETYKSKSESPPTRMLSRGSGNTKKATVFEATAYTAFCDTGCTGVTATGYDVSNRTTIDGMVVIATDPNVIPMYSIVKIRTEDETFTAIALDTGGAIKGHRIDVLVSNSDKAWNFGRQKVSVTVLREGKA